MRLPAKFLGAAIIGLSLLLLGGIWLLKQAVDEGHHITATKSETMIEPYFYQEIGTSRPKHKTSSELVSPLQQYTIELGAVKERGRAEDIVKQLHQQGIEAFYTPLNRQGQVIYRIRTGVFTRKDQAQGEAQRLRAQHQLETRVLSF